MKRFALLLYLMPLSIFAQGFVQVYNSGKILYPTNFASANNFIQVDENGYLKYPQNFFSVNGIVQVDLSGVILSPTNFVSANRLLQVDNAGILTSHKNFVEKNNLVSNEVVCLRVDMLGGDKWTDAEIKILDGTGRLLYFATTIYNDYYHYHSDDGTWDSNCKIFYYVAGVHRNQATGQCSNPKQLHLVDKDNQSSIASKEQQASITGIEFYPNLDGIINQMSVREIVLNPDNTIIISRKNSDGQERDSMGNRIWRPVIPQYYRAYPKELGK